MKFTNNRREDGYPITFDPSTYYQTPEEFISIPVGILPIDESNYMISNWGRIYNKKLDSYVPKELIPSNNRYIIVIIKDINNRPLSVIMHRLVATVFIGPAPPGERRKIVVNHKDGIMWHNEPYNLEWATQSENVQHADRNNLIARAFGQDNGWSALTDDQYKQICQLTQNGYFPNQINKIMNLGFDITNICQKIRKGKSETFVSKEFDFSNIPTYDYKKFSDEQVKFICWCLSKHPEFEPIDIIKFLGYDIDNMNFKDIKKLRDTISTIKRGKCYTRISCNYNFDNNSKNVQRLETNIVGPKIILGKKINDNR